MTPSDRIAAGAANPADKGHTAGPWLRVDIADYAEIHAAFRPSSQAVALVAKPADADLIAAAPDLLNDGALAADMLDMMLKCWVESREISDEEGRQATAALMRFNAAIVRARGAQ